jgi:hypothetical protein
MNIRLTREQEKIVHEELKSGRSTEEVIAEVLRVLREQVRELEQQARSLAGEDNGDQRAAVREMQAFVEQNRTHLDGLSVKQLIHEGRRL